MDPNSLRPAQKRILESLVEQIDDETQTVSGREIADDIGKNPGTIRNRMQSLSALQLIEGIPGPRGGYKPTAAAYRALDDDALDDPAGVPVEGGEQTAREVTVEKIDFVTVHNPEECRAEISVRGSVREFSRGQRITLGPTPSTKLRISGTVEAVDPTTGTITLDVGRMATSHEPIAAD